MKKVCLVIYRNINKNIFNNFLIAAPAPYFFKNCRVPHPHPHPNPETHPCFIAFLCSLPFKDSDSF